MTTVSSVALHMGWPKYEERSFPKQKSSASQPWQVHRRRHGHVALRLARILSEKNHTVLSIIHDAAHSHDINETGASPLVLSLKRSSVHDFAKCFTGVDVVVFAAGAGGKGGADRTKKVDYEGALMILDAIEAVQTSKPRLILNDSDKEHSAKSRETLDTFKHWKYEADKNLHNRTSFKWAILIPGTLEDTPGKGMADIGVTHITEHVSRDDVAAALALLVDRPDAAGLSLDLVGGSTPLEVGLDKAIKNRSDAWVG